MFPWIAPRSCREADDYISDSQELFQAVLLQQLSRHWLHVWVCWQRAACHQGYMGTTNGVMVLLLAILRHFFISLSSVASSLHWGSLIWWPKTIEAQAEWRFPHLENWLISVLYFINREWCYWLWACCPQPTLTVWARTVHLIQTFPSTKLVTVWFPETLYMCSYSFCALQGRKHFFISSWNIHPL